MDSVNKDLVTYNWSDHDWIMTDRIVKENSHVYSRTITGTLHHLLIKSDARINWDVWTLIAWAHRVWTPDCTQEKETPPKSVTVARKILTRKKVIAINCFKPGLRTNLIICPQDWLYFRCRKTMFILENSKITAILWPIISFLIGPPFYSKLLKNHIEIAWGRVL